MGGAVKEVALVTRRVRALVHLDPVILCNAPHVMAGRQTIRSEVLCKGHQVHELHALIAERTGHGRPPARIFVGEMLDDAVAEPAFVIEDVMRDAEPVGDRARIVDVLTGATGAGTLRRFAMIVELQSDADHLRARACGERSYDGAVDAAGHGDDDPCFARCAIEAEIDLHWNFLGSLYPNFTPAG